MFKCQYNQKGKKVGEGAYGEVSLVEKDKQNYVLKRIISEEEKGRKNILSKFKDPIELDIMFKLRSPHLVKGIEITVAGECSPKDAGLVMEYIDGNLADDIYMLSYLEKKKIFYDLCLGIKCMHDNNFLHLDIKPDNAMYRKGSVPVGVVIDYGLASYATDIEEGIITNHPRVTFDYSSPENVEQSGSDNIVYTYTNKDDIWALGITYIDFFISFGSYLVDKKVFTNKNDSYASENYKNLQKLIKDKFNSRQIDNFIQDKVLDYLEDVNKNEKMTLKNLLKNMLQINPKDRCDINFVVNHPYFTEFKTSMMNEITCMTVKPKNYIINVNKYIIQEIDKIAKLCEKEFKEQPLELFFIAVDIFLRYIVLANKEVKDEVNDMTGNLCVLIAYKYFNWSEEDDFIVTINTVSDKENLIYKSIGGVVNQERHYKHFKNLSDAQKFYTKYIKNSDNLQNYLNMEYIGFSKHRPLVAVIKDFNF